MFVETYGKKMAQTVFRGLYAGGSDVSWFGKMNSVTEVNIDTVAAAIPEDRHLLTQKLESMLNIAKSNFE